MSDDLDMYTILKAAFENILKRVICSGISGMDNYILTDAAIHSAKQKFKGTCTDLGDEGMCMVLRGHKCSDVCRFLGLPRSHLRPQRGLKPTYYRFE